MNSKKIFISCAILAMVAFTTIAEWAIPGGHTLKRGNTEHQDNSDKIAMAYVLARFPEIPDPWMFTHLVYAFAVFNDDFDGVVVKYPEKLQAMVYLKEKNPNLKVILGLNDFRRPGFCEMTGDKKKRKAFVKSMKEVVEKYNLDGVDLDWEFPTTEGGGHTASPKDDRNYAELAKDLRKALGKKAWLSYYSNFSGKWIDHKKMLPYVDYVNVSGYNMAAPREGQPMLHHSALYPSDKTGQRCISKAIEHHMDLGIPKQKILMGIPFYAKGISSLPSEIRSSELDKYSTGLTTKWDEEAQAPYLADDQGNLILGYDDERSIEAKFDFIRTNDLPGVFVWCYDFDMAGHKLGKTIGWLRNGQHATDTDSILNRK